MKVIMYILLFRCKYLDKYMHIAVISKYILLSTYIRNFNNT